MVRFRYTAMSLDGRSLSGEMQARDAQNLAAEIGQRGLMLVSVERLGGSKAGLFAGSLNGAAVSAFLGELSLMLRSGLPLDEALDLAAHGAPGRLAAVVAEVRRAVLGGQSFAQALEAQPGAFSHDIIAMARIAETTGDLDGVLAAVAAQRQRAHHLAEKVAGALRYPAFLLVSAASVLAFFLVHVIPQFAGLFADSGSDPGVAVDFVLALSAWLVANETNLSVALAVLLAAGLLASRVPAVRITLTRFVLRLPLVGDVARAWRTSRFLAHLGVLLGQQVPMNQALKVLEDVVGPEGRVQLKAAGDQVRRGERLHLALAKSGLFPDVALRMVRIGEETGELAKVASEAGALYARKLEARLDRLTALVGPIAILVIALIIGGLMVTIMTALVSVNQSVL